MGREFPVASYLAGYGSEPKCVVTSPPSDTDETWTWQSSRTHNRTGRTGEETHLFP